MNVIVAVATCLLGMLGICTAVGLHVPCNDATPCTSSGQTCIKTFGNCVFYGTCEWEQKNDNDACVNSAQCPYGATCTNSGCKCAPGTEYNTVFNVCTDQKELGQTCLTDSDCYLGGASAECSVDLKVCKCISGYTQTSKIPICRHPYATEVCSTATNAPICIPLLGITGAGIVPATCSSGTCTCPTGSTVKTYFQNHIANKACVTDVTMVADGAACTTHGQCNSGFCLPCPGTSTQTCVILPAGFGDAGECQSEDCGFNSGKPIAGLAMWVVMTTLLLLHVAL